MLDISQSIKINSICNRFLTILFKVSISISSCTLNNYFRVYQIKFMYKCKGQFKFINDNNFLTKHEFKNDFLNKCNSLDWNLILY